MPTPEKVLIHKKTFDDILRGTPIRKIEAALAEYDITQVIPDAVTFDIILERIQAESPAFLRGLGPDNFKQIFFKNVSNVSNKAYRPVQRVILFSVIDGRIFSSTNLIACPDDLFAMAALLETDAQREYLFRRITQDNYLSFLEKINLCNLLLELNQRGVRSDLFLSHLSDLLFTDHSDLIGDMKTLLAEIQDRDIKMRFIRLMESNPEYLNSFNDDELANVLNTIADDVQLVAFLRKIAPLLQLRSNVIYLLVKNRLLDIQLPAILLEKYIENIPMPALTGEWPVIAAYLSKNDSSLAIFDIISDKKNLKEILDLYENMTNILEPLLKKNAYYSLWLERLLFPKQCWAFLGDVMDLLPAGGMANGIVIVIGLAISLVISIIGILPALAAGLLYMTHQQPVEKQIAHTLEDCKQDKHMSASELVAGYGKAKDYHTRLKGIDFFSTQPSEKNDGLSLKPASPNPLSTTPVPDPL